MESQYLINDKRGDLQQINFMMATNHKEAAEDYKCYQSGYVCRKFPEKSIERDFYMKDLVESDDTEWDIKVTKMGWSIDEIVDSMKKEEKFLEVKYYKLDDYDL